MGEMIKFGIKIGLTVAVTVALVAALALLFVQISSISFSTTSSYAVTEIFSLINLVFPVRLNVIFGTDFCVSIPIYTSF